MGRHFTIAGLIYLTIALQSGEIVGWTTVAGHPFLPALALIFIAFWCEGAAAIIWSAGVGLLLDGLSPERLGVQVALTAMIGLSLQMLKSASRSRGVMAIAAMVFLTTTVWRVLSPMTYAVLAGRVVDPVQVLVAALGDAMWTAGVAVMFVTVSRWLLGGSSRRETSVAGRSNRWNMLTDSA